MATEQDFINMQKSFYEAETLRMAQLNHRNHDANPDYWNILMQPLSQGDWKEKKALDFACGCGRNVMNMLQHFKIGEVHGCDISQNNINYCINYLSSFGYKNFKFYITNGNDLGDAPPDYYDFIMSTIALQHIPVYVVRRKILEHMARSLNKGGILSIQMGYGESHPNAEAYYANAFHAASTNSDHDVKVTDPSQLINDFKEIGLGDIKTFIRPSFEDRHQHWIFAQGVK